MNKKIVSPEVAAKEGPSKEHPNCVACKRWVTAKTPFLNPSATDDIELAVIGESPGKTGDKFGEQLAGRSGNLLSEWGRDAGLDPDKWFAQTAVRCGADTPTLRQCRLCRPFLLRDLNKHKPKKIVGLGVWASKALQDTGDTTITKDRNRDLTVPGLTYEPELVTLTYNPSAFTHGNEDVKDYITADLSRIATERRVTKNIHQITTLKQLGKLASACQKWPSYGVDIEYDLAGKILIVAVGKGQDAWWFPVDHQESKWDFSQVRPYMETIFGSDAVKIGHKFASDMKAAARWGINTRGRVLDTLILVRMIRSNYIDKSLEHILLRFLNYPDYAAAMKEYKKGFKVPTGELTPTGKPQMKTVRDYGRAPMEILGTYCAWDSIGSYDIAARYVPQAQKQPWWKLYWNVYCKATKVLTRSSLDGFRMYPKELYRQRDEMKKAADHLKRYFILLIRPVWYKQKPFRWKAGGYDPNNDDLRDLLYKRMRFPVEERTKNKQPSVSKEAIKTMLSYTERGDDEWKILSYLIGWTTINSETQKEEKKYGLRQYDKLIGSFIKRLDGLSERRISGQIKCADGSSFRLPAGAYFQPGYSVAAAATGRLTSKPNIQNWPRSIRKAFVTRWPSSSTKRKRKTRKK